MVRSGISVLLDERRALLDGRRIALFTNHTGILPDLRSTVDVLGAAADLRALFTPEHGLLGAAREGDEIAGGTHRSGLPIYSLYGAQFAPAPEQFAPGGHKIDAIVCDIQDIGCRFYTYAWTLVKLIEVAAQHRIAVIVTDRPNPIGGAVEGPGVEADYRSLVGLYDVPIRHGLTLGELVGLVNREAAIGCDLAVVPCAGWRRAQAWPDALPWVAPSPNMPTAATALVYPGTCLLEGVNMSVGRGTAKPFEWLGAPWIDGAALAEALNELALPGVGWRPIGFQPCVQPYMGALCEGVQPHVLDATVFQPVAAGVALAHTLWRLYPDQLLWTDAHFDRLAGSSWLRESIRAGEGLDLLLRSWQDAAAVFHSRVAADLLYD